MWKCHLEKQIDCLQEFFNFRVIPSEPPIMNVMELVIKESVSIFLENSSEDNCWPFKSKHIVYVSFGKCL